MTSSERQAEEHRTTALNLRARAATEENAARVKAWRIEADQLDQAAEKLSPVKPAAKAK